MHIRLTNGSRSLPRPNQSMAAKKISILPYFAVFYDLWTIVPRVSSFSTTFVSAEPAQGLL